MKTGNLQRTDLPRLLPLALALTSVLGGCANMGNQRQDDGSSSGYQPLVMHADALHLQDAIPAGKATTASRQLAAEGIRALDARQYAKANDLFNLALKVDINNSQLHFLNALAYHLRGLGGEGKLYGLAQQGYEQAIQFDGSNAMARHQLGLLFMDRREYQQAVGALMEASLYARNDSDLLYDLAVASYYAKNPRTASAALEGLRQVEGTQLSKRTLRASAIVAACTGDDAGARQFLTQMREAGASTAQVHFAEERVGTWRDSLQIGMMKAQFMQANPGGMTQQPGMMQQPGMGGMQQPGMGGMQQPGMGGMQQPGMGGMMQQPGMMGMGGMPGQMGMGGFFEKKMVMLDVAIVSTEEDNNDTFGINVLDGLRIQFGNTLGTPAASRTTTTNSDLINPLNDTKTQVMTRLINIPAINYTLNIANAQDRRNEVVARPSIVALGGQTSTFFSGTDVVGAAISNGQGGSVQVQKEAGVKLAVTPEFLPDDLIKMQIVAERTFLTNPNSNVQFDFRLDTSKTLVSANVTMKYGESLILSGLSERNLESSNSGVPVLRDVPLVQYLFNRQTKRDFQKSVLIIVTPRRPSYTNRSAEDIEKERSKLSEFERLQSEFEDKYKLWFKPVPNVATSLKVLDTSAIYREFRSGDLELESWVSRATHAGRLKAALQFLYY
jgi:general secretion pathway protein D